MEEKLLMDIDRVSDAIRNQVRGERRSVYATIELVYEVSGDFGISRYIVRDHTLESERRIILGNIKGSIKNHVEKLLSKPFHIGGSKAVSKRYIKMNVKMYFKD